MNSKRSTQAPAPVGPLRRWWSARRQDTAPQAAGDLDVGYESALPWFSGRDDEAAEAGAEPAGGAPVLPPLP